MKKITTILAIILAVLCISCVEKSGLYPDVNLSIKGYMESETKTTFVQDGNVTHTHWVKGDEIGLFAENQANLKFSAVSSGSATEFIAPGVKLELSDGNNAFAYYPFNSNSNSSEYVIMPTTSSINSDDPVPVFLYSEAEIYDNSLNLKFKHYFAYIKVTVPAELFKKNKDSLVNKYNEEYSKIGLCLVSSEPITCISSSRFDFNTKKATNLRDYMHYFCTDVNLESKEMYSFMIPILSQTSSAEISFYLMFKETDGTTRISYLMSKTPPQNGIQAGHVYTLNLGGNITEDLEQKEILKIFYNATDGNNWHNKANWLSDSHINAWYGINNENVIKPYVNTLDLSYNNLKGQLPEEFALLMDKAERINLEGNLLSGDIPDKVKNNSKWQTMGWYVIHQDFAKGGGFNLANSGIYAKDSIYFNLIDDKELSLKDIFASNKLTQIIKLDIEENFNDIYKYINSDKVNRHLSYNGKGLETIIFTGTAKNNNNNINLITGLYGSVTGLNWLAGTYEGKVGYSYFYDTQGQLVYIAPYNAGLDNKEIDTNLNSFLKSVLGEPDNYSEFKTKYYTSTDYSKDGEVYLIQEATKGNGIDIVLIGDGFVDKDMGAGGLYEKKMIEATNKIFSIEPYKKLRDRFNVYVVKVVSPNAEFAPDAKNAINKKNAVALGYASLTGSSTPLVAVLYNTDKYVERSYCQMYWDYTCVAYNADIIDGTLIHELCGHGIAWVADEYIETGNGNLYLPEDEITNLNNIYWKRRWKLYANIDYRDSTVNWNHIIADKRYTAEKIGIYEGAYYYGLGTYRSSETSIMRNSNLEYFNAPSREMIYKAIMMRSEGDKWLEDYNYEDFVAFDEPARNEHAKVRSSSVSETVEELRAVNSRHLPPTVIMKSWRDEFKKK